MKWVLSFAALWLILAMMTDAGAGELATALAAVAFTTLLYWKIADGSLPASLASMGLPTLPGKGGLPYGQYQGGAFQ